MLAGDRRTREINWFPFNSRTRHQLASCSDFATEQPDRPGTHESICSSLSWSVLGHFLHPRAQSKTQTHLTIDVRLHSAHTAN